MSAIPSYIHQELSWTEWQTRVQPYKNKLRDILDPYLEKRGRGFKDPVKDFLFEYYAFRPSKLQQWSPGFGVAVKNFPKKHLPDPELFMLTPAGYTIDPARFPEDRHKSARWIHTLLQETEKRTPFFGCHGLHEWAMVYRTDNVRHSQVPLRMPPEELAKFVESQSIACTHFDAFRFFTPKARPLNHFKPSHDKMPELEQPGCIHTNMDVYRWAFKFYPWIPSRLIVQAFLAASRARKIDMRASPYDLQEYGLDPIRIETKKGRQKYQKLQQQISKEVAPLRRQLQQVYKQLLAHV